LVEAVEVIIIHVGSLGITRGYGRYIEAVAPYLDSMIPDAQGSGRTGWIVWSSVCVGSGLGTILGSSGNQYPYKEGPPR